MLALSNLQEGYLTALHNLEAGLEIGKGSLIIHDEVIGYFALLV